jgi:hypothetical protein
MQAAHTPVQLANVTDLADLAQHLVAAREQEQDLHLQAVVERADAPWDYSLETEIRGLRIVTLSQGAWVGQMVKDGASLVYLSIFRALATEKEEQPS